MEQPALLTIIRSDTVYRFRLDTLDGAAPGGQEYITELTAEVRERLRRVLQSATQQMQTLALTEMKRQTMKLSVVNDSLLTLGRILFDTVLPAPIQETLRHLDTALIVNTNTPDIPWEIMFDGNPRSGHYLCQRISIGRQVYSQRDSSSRAP